MATKYHFNKDTGRTGKCEAKIKCRLGLKESEHFETKEEAQSAFEKTMSSKTVRKPLKKAYDKARDVDTYKFSTPGYGQLQNKTAAEARQYIKDIHDKYDGQEDAIKQDIAEKLGLDKVPGFNDGYGTYMYFGDTGVLEVHKDVHINFDPDELINSYDYEATNYIDVEYTQNDAYIDSELTVGGYYNDESHVTIRYDVPEEFNDDLAGLQQFDKYVPYYRNASNPNLPDWASLPKEVTMDMKPKNKVNGATKVAKPGDPSARINKLNKIIENDKEIQRLKKANQVLAKRSDISVKMLHEIRDYENSDNKRGFNFVLNPKFRSLSPADRKWEKRKLEGSINGFNTDYLKNSDKIKDAENITQADKFQAAFKIREINKEYEDKSREYKIDRLSDLYPHSKESVRKKYATEWVDSHSDLDVNNF